MGKGEEDVVACVAAPPAEAISAFALATYEASRAVSARQFASAGDRTAATTRASSSALNRNAVVDEEE